MRITSLLLVAAALAPQLSSQDQAAGGFALRPMLYPGATTLAASATLSGGEVVVFDGLTVRVYLEDGTLQRELTFFQQFLFPSFVRIDPTESYALVGESSNGLDSPVPSSTNRMRSSSCFRSSSPLRRGAAKPAAT